MIGNDSLWMKEEAQKSRLRILVLLLLFLLLLITIIIVEVLTSLTTADRAWVLKILACDVEKRVVLTFNDGYVGC